MSRPLVVKLTAGAEEAERANQAFTVASMAVAAGSQVSLWLTGEAVWFAVPGRAEELDLPLATPLSQLRDLVLDSGRITACSQCTARRSIDVDQLVAGAEIRGAAAFTEEILAEGVQALVY